MKSESLLPKSLSGGGALKNRLYLSFFVALSNFAYANVCTSATTTISGNSINQECTLTNSHTAVSIQTGGMLKKILIQGGATIDNQGHIINSEIARSNGIINSYSVRLHNTTATIESLKNSGSIKSNEYGVNFDSTTGAVTTKNLINSGTMQGDKNEGVYVGGEITVHTIQNTGSIGDSQGFWIIEKGSKNLTIQTLENSGSISGSTRGIVLNQATIENLNNKGTIKGSSHAGVEVRTKSTIKNLTLDGNGAKITGGGLVNAYTNNSNGNDGVIKNISVESGGLIEGLENANKDR